jgi:hypothetical protein
LCFVDGEDERLSFFLVKVIQLFLNTAEHGGFPATLADTKDAAELFVKIRNTNGGQTDILHAA